MKAFIRRLLLKSVIILLGVLPASAELPMVRDGQWLGYFAVAREKTYQLTVSAVDLSIVVQPVNKIGDLIEGVPVTITFGISQTLPDGNSMTHALRLDTLETSSPATEDLQRVSFQCKTAGDAIIEVSMEKAKGAIMIEGRVVESGTLPKESLKPVILMNSPSIYGVETQKKSEWTRDETKNFEKKIAKDRIRLKWLDGTSKKLESSDVLNADIRKTIGGGIVSAEIGFSNWQERSLYAVTGGECSMSITQTGPSLLHEGFNIRCAPDSLKTPERKVWLNILMK